MLTGFANQIRATELPAAVNAAELLAIEPEAPDQILEDIFDVKDKLAIIGSSKMRKSFFLLMLLLCLAAGRNFLKWRIPKPRRVLHFQYEIEKNHFHRRVRRMCRAMGITPSDLGDRFHIVNARGLNLSGLEGIEKISQICELYHPELISFDPLYKLSDGQENSIEGFKIILNAFDNLIEKTSAAITYLHHDAKGYSGDRDIRDRGAGSNILGRDYDAGITLTPHVSEADAAVIETVLRNYRPQEPFTILWTEAEDTGGYMFNMSEEIAPTKRTSANNKIKNLPALNTYVPAALELLENGPMPIGLFMDALRTKTGLTYSRTTAFKTWCISGAHPVFDTFAKRSRGKNEKLIGQTLDITRLKGLDK
ncbi:MAG: AAA family ATPase [Elusimicrobiota bacterium]